MASNSYHQKTTANAISAYLMLFISITFLLNRDNPHLHNDFVKWHTKKAFCIHILFLIVYVLFVQFKLLGNIDFSGISANYIWATTLFLGVLLQLIYGIYSAYKWVSASDISIFSVSTKNLLDVNNDSKFSEQDKITLILSLIPLIGFIQYPKYKSNTIIENNTKLSMLFMAILLWLHIFWHPNIANIWILIYVIYVCFTAVQLLSINKVSYLHLEKVPNLTDIRNHIYTLFLYFKNYLSGNFKEYKNLEAQIQTNNLTNKKKTDTEIKKLPDFPLPKYFIYIPVINLISIKSINSKYREHIKNGIGITIICAALATLSYIWYLDISYILFMLFPICFWIWYIHTDISYKMPFISDMYHLVSTVFKKLFSIFQKADTLRKTETNTSFKTKKEAQK